MKKKKVLVLYSTVGMGHKKAAMAVYDELKTRDDVEVEIMDAIDHANRLYKFLYIDLYVFAVSRAKWLWGAMYYFSSIDIINNQLCECEELISKLKKEITAENKKYKELSSHLILKKSEYQSISEDIVGKQQLAVLQKEFAEAKKRIKKIKDTISDNNNIIKNNSSLVQKSQEKLIILDDKINAKKGLNISQKRDKLLKGKAQEKIMRDQISQLKKDIKLK